MRCTHVYIKSKVLITTTYSLVQHISYGLHQCVFIWNFNLLNFEVCILCVSNIPGEGVLIWMYVFSYYFTAIVYIVRLYCVIFYYMLVTFGLPIPLQFWCDLYSIHQIY